MVWLVAESGRNLERLSIRVIAMMGRTLREAGWEGGVWPVSGGMLGLKTCSKASMRLTVKSLFYFVQNLLFIKSKKFDIFSLWLKLIKPSTSEFFN